jgi:hypothetical protein
MIQEKALELAAKLLKVDTSELESRPLENATGFYAYQPIRGGGALVIANDGSVLFANSSVNPEDHLKAFYEGKRTSPDLFQ